MDIDLLLEMLRIDSTSSRERNFAMWLAGRLRAPGRRVETFEVGDGTLNLRVCWGEADPQVVFCTHLDTVPPYFAPEVRPVRAGDPLPDGSRAAADDLLLTGRGTCDAKGQAFAMIQACLQLEAEGRSGFGLLLLAGEETGSFGAKAYAKMIPSGGHAVVVGEPTGGRMVSATKGTKAFEIVLRGRPCHSGYPGEGASAVDAFVDFVRALRAAGFPEDPLLGPTTWNIGRLRSDNPQNILSPEVAFRLYFRTTFVSEALVDPAVRAALAAAGCGLSGSAPAGSGPSAKGFTAEVKALGGDTPMHYWTAPGEATTVAAFGSDAPHLSGFVRRALCGPGSILVAHTDREYILLSQLEAAAGQYVRIREALVRDAQGGSF